MSFVKLLKSESGLALVFFAILMPVMLGLAVMVVDVGRAGNLHLDLQNAADGLALAAAAELDGKDDSIDRAELAIQTLVDNQARFGDGQDFIVDNAAIQVFFLEELPAKDDIEIGAADVLVAPYDADEQKVARFVAVYVNPVNYSLIFPLNFFNPTTVPISGHAVAGFQRVVCDYTPMFICNPYETLISAGPPPVYGSPDLETIVQDITQRRRMIEMRQKGPSASYTPGNFGYLHSPEGNPGANELRRIIASSNPNACYGENGVDLRPGVVSSVRTAFNVRFDAYDGYFSGSGPNSAKNNPEFRPARTVRKGYKFQGNACNAALVDPPEPANFMALPRDNCFLTSPESCTDMGGRRGNGNWDIEQYWQTNFGTTPPNGWNNSNLPTRYEAYRYEVDNGLINTASAGGEVGRPLCYKNGSGGGDLTDDPDRRLIYAAIINCLENAANMNGAGENIPVVEFASFFLTEPVQQGGPNEDVVRAEIVDITGRSGLGTLTDFARDDVQLYR